MQQSLPRLFARPILFAHRGANLVHPENSLPAFSEALRLGATGLETDLWITRDDVVVIDHDGVVRSGLRRRPIRSLARQDLQGLLPTWAELLQITPETIDVSVDIKDPGAFSPFLDEVHRAGRNAHSVWVCHPDLSVLGQWQTVDDSFSFVHSSKLRVIEHSPEHHARQLRDQGVKVCNMHWRDWSGGLVAMYHRFEIACFAWGLMHVSETKEMLRIGIDALYADDVAMLVGVSSAFTD